MNNVQRDLSRSGAPDRNTSQNLGLLQEETIGRRIVESAQPAIEARQLILAGVTGAEFRQAVEVILNAITQQPAIADGAFQDQLREKVTNVARSPFADPSARIHCMEILARIDPFDTKFLLIGMLFQESNGGFAARELSRLTDVRGASGEVLPKAEVIDILKGNIGRLMEEFSSLDGDYAAQRRIRTGMLNQSSFMAASNTVEGREFLEDLFNCRDYDLHVNLLSGLGQLGGAAVQSLYVIGEYRNQVASRFNSDDADDLSNAALWTMEQIAQGYSEFSAERKADTIPVRIIEELRDWLEEGELFLIADKLT